MIVTMGVKVDAFGGYGMAPKALPAKSRILGSLVDDLNQVQLENRSFPSGKTPPLDLAKG
jgi:hypothetical protein